MNEFWAPLILMKALDPLRMELATVVVGYCISGSGLVPYLLDLWFDLECIPFLFSRFLPSQEL